MRKSLTSIISKQFAVLLFFREGNYLAMFIGSNISQDYIKTIYGIKI